MSAPSPALVQSVHARLVRHAHSQDLEPNLVLSRFAAERLLYRLSISPHRHRFVLKGAFLLIVWLGEMVRPTRDVDLLGFGELSAEPLAAEELTITGEDASAAMEEILDLKRRLREGPELHAGDFLADDRFRLLERLGKGGFATV